MLKVRLHIQELGFRHSASGWTPLVRHCLAATGILRASGRSTEALRFDELLYLARRK